MANFNLDDYIQVNERIENFYKKYPTGSIQTEIVSNADGNVIIKAYAYKSMEDTRPCTGHAMEKEGSTYINKTSHVENCETSAVGRALAMMGLEIKKHVASREEIINAQNAQKKLVEVKKPEPKLITSEEAKNIYAVAGFKGITKDGIVEWVAKKWNKKIKSLTEITEPEALEISKALKALPDKVKEVKEEAVVA